MDKESLKKIIDTALENDSTFKSESKRRAKLEENYGAKFGGLVEKYKEFAHEFENIVDWMYVDAVGYLTVGCGHLLGYDWRGFWGSDPVVEVMQKLEKQVYSNHLISKNSFRSIDFPEDVKQFFTVDDASLIAVFQVPCVRNALREAFSLPFMIGSGKKKQGQTPTLTKKALDESPDIKQTMVAKAAVELVRIGLMLCARQRAKGVDEPTNNPFLGRGFYHDKENHLVLSDTEVQGLLSVDILAKISFLNNEIPDFSDVPFNVQLGILDLAFTGTSKLIYCISLVKEKKWSELSSMKNYGSRNKTMYTKRNQKIEKLFESVSEKINSGR